MKRKFAFRIISIGIVFAVLLGACAPASSEEAPTALPQIADPMLDSLQPGRIVLAQDLLMLTPDMISKIQPINQETNTTTPADLEAAGGVLEFYDVDLAGPELSNITVGSIMQSGVTDEMPFGLLRRVVAVNPVGTNELSVVTVQATLEEAIQEGEFTVGYNDQDWSVSAINGHDRGGALMSIMPSPMSGPIEIPLESVVLYDDQQGGRVIANGTILVSPDFDLHMKIFGAKMKKFNFENRTTITADVTIESHVEYRVSEKKEIYSKYLPTWEFPVGGMMVVITPKLSVSIGLDGKISTGISVGTLYQNTITASVSWDKENQWVYSKDSSPTATFTPPASKITADAKIYARPRLDLLLYGVAGPYAQVEGYFQWEASTDWDPWWTLEVGLIGIIGVKIELFGFVIAEPDPMEFTFYKEIIDDAGKESDAAAAADPVETEPPPEEETPPEDDTTTTISPPEEDDNDASEAPPPEEDEETQPPAISGDDNILLVYDPVSANLINISQSSLSVKELEFRRIDSDGNTTASYKAETWGFYYDRYSPVHSNNCLIINIETSPRPSSCTSNQGFFTTSKTNLHFWRKTPGSTQFEVWQNETLLKTCEISAGSCTFYLPPP